MPGRRRWIALVMATSLLFLSSMANADEYDSTIMRPAHWIVSHERLAEVFGHED
jgi:hypothetical protein